MSIPEHLILRSLLSCATSVSLLVASHVAIAAGTNTTATSTPSTVPAAIKIATPDKEIVFSAAQVKNIEHIAHDYIVKNPKVLMEAAQVLQKEMEADQEKINAESKELAHKLSPKIFASNNPVLGSTTPQIIVAEFFSYQCPNCRATEEAIDELLRQNKNVKVVFIPWSFEGAGDVYAAQLTLASQKQGRFFDLHRAFMASTELLTPEKADKIAQNLKLNVAELKQDAKSAAITNELKANFKLAQELKLTGVPAIFVTNGNFTKISLIPGRADLNDLNKAIKEVN